MLLTSYYPSLLHSIKMHPLFTVFLFVLSMGESGERKPVTDTGLSRHMMGRPINVGNVVV